MSKYNRNVAILSLAASVLLIATSIKIDKKDKVMPNVFLAGGLMCLLYGIGRSIAANNIKFTFISIAVSLAVVMVLGYRKFDRK